MFILNEYTTELMPFLPEAQLFASYYVSCKSIGAPCRVRLAQSKEITLGVIWMSYEISDGAGIWHRTLPNEMRTELHDQRAIPASKGVFYTLVHSIG